MRGILTLLMVSAAAMVAAPLPARASTDDCALPGAAGVPADDNRKKWWGDEGWPTNWERFVRPQRTVRAVMLFVDFPNARAEDNAAPFDGVDAYHDFLGPGADWLRRSSYGGLNLKITPVRKWLRMPLQDADYGIVRTMPLQTQARYVRHAIELADGVDFSDYDLVYVVPSRNAVNIALSPAYVDPAGAVTHGVTFGRDMWSWGFKILVHETGHTFGLPDLYLEPGEDRHAAVRGWDVMGNIAGHAPDFLAWHKWKLDWLRDDQVDCVTQNGTTQHRLSAVERPGGTKAVVVRTGERTAYVVESRRDAACSTGALVYAVTSPLRSGEGPVRVVDATPDSPETASCRDLDIATLQPGRALRLPGDVTVELVRRDTVEIAKGARPVFRNGQAQVVPEFSDATKWVRQQLWVETELDTDGDGRRDRMHTDVTRPAQTDSEGLKVPTIYMTSPYYGGTSGPQSSLWNVNHELGEALPPRIHQPPIPHQPDRTFVSTSGVSTWVPRAFAVVHSDSPGTGLSEGCPTVGAPNESLAPKAVVDWLNGRAKAYTSRTGAVEVKAGWSTGKVGMTGTSYGGTLPLAAATTGVEGLEAIIPIAPNTSYYHYYRSNGLVRHPGGWLGEDIDFLFDYINSGYPEKRQYCIDKVRTGEMNANQDRITGDYNDFWAGRDYLNQLRRLRAPTLMAHAFNDWNVVPEHSVRISEALKRKGVPLQQYFHQGGHGGAPPMVMQNKWFTRYLYGVRNGVERDPKAWIAREPASCPSRTATVTGDQSSTATLKVADASALTLGLTLTIPQTNADGTIASTTRVIDSIPDSTTVVLASPVATDPGQRVAGGATVSIVCNAANPTPYEDYPNTAASPVTLRPQPGGGLTSLTRPGRAKETLVDDVGLFAGELAQAASSPHRLLYATPPLSAPLHVSGTPSMRIRLASSKPAANLSIMLVVLPWTGSPTSNASVVTRGWADPQNHRSLSRSRPLRPRRFYDLEVPLQPADQVIPAGSRLGLMIFSSDRQHTLWPRPGTELTVDLRGTSLELPIVDG